MDGFPLQLERIILLGADPKKVNPSILNGPAKLFVPKSVRQRIEFFSTDKIFEVVEPEEFPASLGGKYVEKLTLEEWRAERKRQYQETCSLLYDSIIARESKL